MSQAKVDQYKKEKANRKKTLARDKRKHTAAVIAGWIICLAIVGWAGYSGYNYYIDHRPAKDIYCDVSDLTDYINSLNSEE